MASSVERAVLGTVSAICEEECAANLESKVMVCFIWQQLLVAAMVSLDRYSDDVAVAPVSNTDKEIVPLCKINFEEDAGDMSHRRISYESAGIAYFPACFQSPVLYEMFVV